jgi:predicted ATPase/DNA-binding CsgD family transcriptional regulator
MSTVPVPIAGGGSGSRRSATSIYLSSFVGRREELRRISSLLLEQGARLLTLTGPSGVGKTRLALHAAERLSSHFDHTVWLVELGPVDDPDLVGVTIAREIGVPSITAGPPEDAIITLIGERPALLILDNFEHLLDAATLIARLLLSCPNLHIIVTSQAVLRLSGEYSLAIGPLPTPAGAETRLADLESVEATTLFLERARAISQDYASNDADAPSIAEIARRLDGIPLALEIAASRANVLTPQSLLARLDRDLLDITERSRDRPQRQQTLRAAIAWSYGFLNQEEKTVFRRLSVFRGGFELDAATEVAGAGDPHAFLETLSALVDRSLVRRLTAGMAEERFSILTAPWEFAREQLSQSGDCALVCERHFTWFLGLANQSDIALIGPAQAEWVARLSREQGNVRAALGWAIGEGDADRSLALAAALWRFWSLRGNLDEARSWLSQALALPGSDESHHRARALHHLANITLDQGDFDAARVAYEQSHQLLAAGQEEPLAFARAFNGLGLVNYFQGDYAAAEDFHQRALAIRQEHGDQSGIGNSLTNLGDVALAQGDLATARALHEESLRVRQRLEDDNAIGYSLFNLGAVAFYEGNPEQADQCLVNALRLLDQTGDPGGKGYALHFLGRNAIERGDPSTAAAHLRDALQVRASIGTASGIIECLEEIAALAAAAGAPGDAAELAAVAIRERERHRVPMPPVDRSRFEAMLAAVQSTLGERSFGDHISAGRLIGLGQASSRAAGLAARIAQQPEPLARPAAGRSTLLSPREVEVLRLAAQGLTDQEIADVLFMSRRTATTHQSNIRQKLGVQNRAEAVALASREGLI